MRRKKVNPNNMKSDHNLKRFLDAQENSYNLALAEIRQGRKQSHWMWYIFPQISGLGFSETAKFYAIKDLNEAGAYLDHPLLGSRLIDISNTFLGINGKSANAVLGSPDDLKMKSSMTLFSLLPNTNPVFQAVLDKFFGGRQDEKTLAIVKHGQ